MLAVAGMQDVVWQDGTDASSMCAEAVAVTKLAFSTGAYEVVGDVGVEFRERAALVATSVNYEAGRLSRVGRAFHGNRARRG